MSDDNAPAESSTTETGRAPKASAARFDRSAVLAEMEQIEAGGEPAAAAAAAKPVAAAKPKVEASAAAADEVDEDLEAGAEGEAADRDAGDTEVDEDLDDASAVAAAAAAKKKDPELEKRLAVVQRNEKRSRDRIAAERAALDTDRATVKEGLARVQKFEDRARRVRYDATSVLLELGVPEEDLEPIAQQIYSRSKAAKATPANRAAADALMREREHTDELTKLRKTVEDLQGGLSARDQQAAAAAAAHQFVAGVVEAATPEEAPLVARMLARSPGKANERIAQVAMELLERNGETPDAADVIAELERARRAELEDAGVDVDELIKKPIAAAKPAAAAASAVPGKRSATLAAGGGTTRAAKAAPANIEDKRSAVRRQIESGQPLND